MTSTEICNMALSHLNVSKEISDLDTDSSAQAQACRRFYENALEEVLEDFAWPFATKFAELALVEEDPTSEWGFSYRYPSDCLGFRRIISGIRNDNRQSKVPYKIGQDDTARLIYTDMEDAECEYGVNVTDTSRFTASFITAFSLYLASLIAPRVTGGDPFKLGERAMRLYVIKKGMAEAKAANEQQDEEHPPSEAQRARE